MEERRKMIKGELAEYFIGAHQEALRRDPKDRLDAVIHPGATPLVNRFTDHAHRLGMKKAFAYLENQLGTLSNRSVLDVGCGRGRWVREFARRGAKVTGVDISQEAIDTLVGEMPAHRFLCQDVTCLRFPEGSFDIVNSVTVIQHLPVAEQGEAIRLLSSCLREGGYFVLLENCADFGARHVFPRRPEEWQELVRIAGLGLCGSWGSNYEVLFRGMRAVAGSTRRRSFPGGRTARGASAWASPQRRVGPILKDLVALLSFPAEWVANLVPLAQPTHCVMVFRK